MRIGPWTLVGTLAVAQLVSWGSLFYSFALFVVPMEAELGWSRAELNGALSLGLLVAGLAALPIGAWIDRRGAWLVMTGGSLLGAAACLAWSGVDNVLVFYAIWVALGLAQAATLYEPAFAVITANLGAQARQGILYVTLLGGFAGTVFAPLTQWLIDSVGWRDALLILSLGNILLCAVIHAVVLRGTRPPLRPHPPQGAGAGPLRRALRSPAFWGLLLMVVCNSFAFTALVFHIIPLLRERAVPMAVIIVILTLVGPAQVIGRLVLLAFGRRLRAVKVGIVPIVCLPVALLILLLLPPHPLILAVYAVMHGIGNGVLTIARGIIIPEILGTDGYATVSGALALPATVARAAGPLAAAAIWTYGGYDSVLWLMLGLSAFGATAYFAGVRPLSQRPS